MLLSEIKFILKLMLCQKEGKDSDITFLWKFGLYYYKNMGIGWSLYRFNLYLSYKNLNTVLLSKTKYQFMSSALKAYTLCPIKCRKLYTTFAVLWFKVTKKCFTQNFCISRTRFFIKGKVFYAKVVFKVLFFFTDLLKFKHNSCKGYRVWSDVLYM